MSAAGVKDRVAAMPLWQSAVIVHLALRLLALPALLGAVAADPKRPFLNWFYITDGYWYRQIASQGYTHDLVINSSGQLAEPSAIAFYPLFPFSVRAVMEVTRLPFSVAGPLTGFLWGMAGSVTVAYLVRAAARVAVEKRPTLPLLAVAAVNAYPAAAVLSFAYSEGLALTLIASALLLISRRRYGWAILPAVALGFTRAVALPLAAVLIWHVILRIRSGERPSRPEWLRIGIALVVSVASGFIWPVVAGWLAGNSSAFFLAQSYYRNGGDATVPFRGFSERLSAHLPSSVAVLVIVLLVVAVVAMSFTRQVRELGPELQAWGGSYLLYLIAVSDLDVSGVRFLLLAITPAVLVVSWWRRRTVGYVMLGLMLVGQYLWVYAIWANGLSLGTGA